MKAPSQPGMAQSLEIQQKLLFEGRFHRGINWFYWIAGLSLIDTIASLAGVAFAFVIGLGVTRFVDAALTGLPGEGFTPVRVGGFVFDIAMAGAFVIFGLLGTARRRPVIIIGMAVYALDAVLLLFLRDYLGAAFHAWVLLRLFGGLLALGHLQAAEVASGETMDALRARLPEVEPGPTPQARRLRLILLGILGLAATIVFLIRSTGSS